MRAERLFRQLARGTGAPARARTGSRPRATEEALALLQRLEGLRTALLALPDRPESIGGLAGRALTLAGELAFLFKAEDDSHVYFIETRGRGVFLRGDADRRLGAAEGAALRRACGPPS